MSKLYIILYVIFTGVLVNANTLFEGWFEIYVGEKKIGYSVQRYEFVDNKFKVASFTKTVGGGVTVNESLKSTSKGDFTPIDFSYTLQEGSTVKVLDGTLKDEILTVKSGDGSKTESKTKKIRKGTFSSSVLLYLIMSQPDGMKEGKSFDYMAIDESTGTAYKGSAFIQKTEKIKGKDTYKMLNKFKTDDPKNEERFFVWASQKGETVLMRAPDKNVEMRLSDSMSEATKDFTVEKQTLKLLFNGKIPGSEDMPAEPTQEKKNKKLSEKNEVTPSKKAGVPQGQNIQIKGVPPPSSSQPPQDQ